MAMCFSTFDFCAGLDLKFMNTGMAFGFFAPAVNAASGNNGHIRSFPYNKGIVDGIMKSCLG